MKLSPPASSSDLETARGIARRLHQQRRREDHPELGAHVATPRPALRAPEAIRPHVPTPTRPPRPPAPEPEPPSWDEPAAEVAPATDAAIDPLAGFGEPAPAPDEGDGDVPDIEVEEPPVSPEEMVGAAAPPLEDLPEPEPDDVSPPSPFDVDLDETAVPEEEVIDAPAPPSWDDLAEACLGLAQARGAMLVDPAGRVFAARGEWPEPGPDAIAAKLVATMDRTLRDAPTRSISAPLVGKHLTAWRVPLPEGLVTAAFIGDSPVRAEARPAIDTEIHRGAGA
jgi:hypothetical protein